MGTTVEVVVVGGGDEGGGVEVGPLGVLSLSLVSVLVAAEGLGGGEVPAAVMALEFPAATLPAGVLGGSGGGGGGFMVGFAVGGALPRVAGGLGGSGGGGGGEFDSEKADGRGGGLVLGGGGGGGADEGELREGVNVHEVMVGLIIC